MGILTDADDRLRQWIGSIVGGVEIASRPPSDDVAGPLVAALLLELAPALNVRSGTHRPAPFAVRLRYLVCTQAPDSHSALELLESLLVAAVDAEEMQLGVTAPSPETWHALGISPRPCVTLELTAHHLRPASTVKPVLHPLSVVAGSLRPLVGRVLGPGDVPLAGAVVAVPGTGASTRASDSGVFSFAAVPTGPLRLSLRVKGRTFSVDTESNADTRDEPLLIRCDPLEE